MPPPAHNSITCFLGGGGQGGARHTNWLTRKHNIKCTRVHSVSPWLKVYAKSQHEHSSWIKTCIRSDRRCSANRTDECRQRPPHRRPSPARTHSCRCILCRQVASLHHWNRARSRGRSSYRTHFYCCGSRATPPAIARICIDVVVLLFSRMRYKYW